jgi:hypothetical protein
MSWNGSGVFNRLYSWVADKAAGLDISSTRMDADTNDIATNGFGNCLTRDGQGQPTANLPMANFRHTGVSPGVARTDYPAMSQLQDGLINWTAAGGTVDAIAATYTPALTALNDGQLCFVRATGANTSTTPTFNPNGLGAATITRRGGTALVAGDIANGNYECIFRYNLTNTRWEMLNPAAPLLNPVMTGSAAVTIPTGNTAARPGSPAAAQMRFNSQTVAFEGFDGAAWRNLNSPNNAAPTITLYNSSSGNYATPAGAVSLWVRYIGAGGGGGGTGAGSTAGGSGGTTTFNGVNAAGGGGGGASTTANSGSGGSGGTGGTGSATFRLPGGGGQHGSSNAAGMGGAGAASPFGGAGQGGSPSVSPTQGTNGSGGGGSGQASGSFGGGGAGGAGEYVELIIANPTGNYAYSVGSGGSAGTGPASGTLGGSGVILVTAYFQ